MFDDNEIISLDQARNFLIDPQEIIFANESFLPILTWGSNSELFFGFHELVSLASYFIRRYGLAFKNFDLYNGNECVAKYEVWQEGYEDETYSRQLLSYGTRLLIHKNLLQNILQDYHAELCQSVSEDRYYYKNRFSPKATNSSKYRFFRILSFYL